MGIRKTTVFMLFASFLFLSPAIISQVSLSLRMEYNETPQDGGKKIAVDNQGNIFITGNVNASGQGIRMVTTKYNSAGNILWQKKYRGPGFEDRIAGLELDEQGNCYIGGYSEGSEGSFHYMLIKYSGQNGDTLFVKRRGRSGEALCFTKDNQGNFYLGGGETNAGVDGYSLVKYSPAGDTLWSAFHSGSAIRTIDTDAQGNIYVSGNAFSNLCFTIKYNSNGVQQWENTATLSMGTTLLGMRLIKRDALGNTYVGGYRFTNTTTREDIVLIKYNSAGAFEWERRFVNDGRNDYANSLTIDNAGDIIVAGYSYNPATGGDYDLLLLKYNSAGQLLWNSFFPKAGAHSMQPCRVITDSQNNIYTAGGGVECFVVKYSSAGDTLWSTYTKGNATSGVNNIFDMCIDATWNIYCGGTVVNTSTGLDMVTLKYSQTPLGITPVNSDAHSYKLSQNFPNPFNPSTSFEFDIPKSGFVKLTVYDYAGREIETLINMDLNAGTYKAEWNAADYASGVYFYKLTVGNYSAVKKMILIK